MTGKLDGLTILVAESRELDLFTGMLEAEGAAALRCPLVRILDLEDFTDVDAWLARFVVGAFDDLILLTGEGLRRLLAHCERLGSRDKLLKALARVRTITRGPKPAKVLRELGLSPSLTASAPTSQGVIDILSSQNLRGRSVGVQLYPGPGASPLLSAVERMGAHAFPVVPYRYASQVESRQVAEIILEMAAGRIGMVAFTSSPQVERLAEVARECGLEKELAEGYSRTLVASIGPVVERALRAHGVTSFIQPKDSFHLKPLVRAITAAWSAKSA
jgi:uroporphyrinogen-III synthase